MLYTEYQINTMVDEIMNSEEFIHDTKDMNEDTDPCNIQLMCYVGLIKSGEFPDKLMLSKKEIVKKGLLKHIREQEMKIARDIPSSCERRRIW